MDHLLKTKKELKKFKETVDTNYFYKNELDKCFQYDMAYGNVKDLAKRTASDKFLIDKTLILLKILKMMDIKGGLLLWFTIFFNKKSAGNGVNMHANNECTLDLAEELHKPVIQKF